MSCEVKASFISDSCVAAGDKKILPFREGRDDGWNIMI
jgi:hypothetical protein